MKQKYNYQNILNASLVTILGIVAVLYLLYPYWLFGKYSAMGWYDERYSHIPFTFFSSLLGYSHGFMPGYQGGIQAATMQDWGFISLYHILLTWWPLMVASFVFRFIALGLMLLSSYFFLRQCFQLTCCMAFSLALFVCSDWYLNGWILGGYGFTFPSIFIMLIGFFCKFQDEKRRLLYYVLSSCLVAITTSPVYFLIFMGFIFIFCVIFIKGCDICSKKRLLSCLSGWLIMISISSLNWAKELYFMLVKYSSDSSRIIMHSYHAISIQETFTFVWQQLQSLLVGLHRGTGPAVMLTFLLLLLLPMIMLDLKNTRSSFFELIFIILFPIFLATLFFIIQIPLLSTFKWGALSATYAIACVLAFANLIKGIKQYD